MDRRCLACRGHAAAAFIGEKADQPVHGGEIGAAPQAAAFAPTATLDRCTRLQNQFGTDDPSSYPTFLPQGGIGGTGVTCPIGVGV